MKLIHVVVLIYVPGTIIAGIQKRASAYGCEAGSVIQHTNPPPSWPYIRHVHFSRPFSKTPAIVLGTSLLDLGDGRNTRVNAYVVQPTRWGFYVRINTWSDTRLYGVRMNWMACPRRN